MPNPYGACGLCGKRHKQQQALCAEPIDKLLEEIDSEPIPARSNPDKPHGITIVILLLIIVAFLVAAFWYS